MFDSVSGNEDSVFGVGGPAVEELAGHSGLELDDIIVWHVEFGCRIVFVCLLRFFRFTTFGEKEVVLVSIHYKCRIKH